MRIIVGMVLQMILNVMGPLVQASQVRLWLCGDVVHLLQRDSSSWSAGVYGNS